MIKPFSAQDLNSKKWQARRDSNPQQPDLESGALPLELLACNNSKCKVQHHHAVPAGSVSSTFQTLNLDLRLGFLMDRMLAAEPAILIQIQLVRRVPLVLRR
jgi:hypothetical protein